MIDRLERESVDAFRSLSSRGSEIGGLLVGDVTTGSPLVVSIADYELIACDYARGPLYRLAEADMERFQRAMDQRKGPGQTVAGFFRSHTRKGISLDADDLAFYQACFREPHHIGLLVRPFATKASTAGIFIWEGGKVHGDASYLEFPFHTADLSGRVSENAAPEAKASAPVASPSAAKPPVRAQIVPIASRRDAPVAEPAPATPPPPPPVAAAPPAVPEPPKVEEKPAPAEPKFDNKLVKKEIKDKPAESPKAAVTAPAPAKPAAPAPSEPAISPALTKALVASAGRTTATPAKLTETAAVTDAEPKSGKGLKLVLAALATIALFVALFVYPGLLRHTSKTPTLPQGDSSPLQLRVERSNGELLLTWNRDTDAIKNATKATLLITDGEQHENVDMDLSQLRNNGSIVYSPSSADVSFKMEVIGRDQTKTTSESVRILRTRPSPLDAQPADVKAATPAAAPLTKAANTPATTPDKPAATPAPAEEQPQPAAQEAPKPVVASRRFDTASLSQRIRPAAPSDIPDAPTAGGAVSAAIPGVSLPSAGAVPSAPVAPPPAPRAPAPVVTAPVNSKQGGNIQQAVLITRKEPEYPKIAKQTGAKGVVTLNATIGKDGRIRVVKVISGHPMLQNAAVEAVKQWIYKPTLLNGTPVETETQIMLNFVGER